jgi:hypothetical protein
MVSGGFRVLLLDELQSRQVNSCAILLANIAVAIAGAHLSD